MRLWTVHPRYLDAKGLVAAWREALLAQKVLAGGTRGYRRHPQLERFRGKNSEGKIGRFLEGLAAEARRRGYRFDEGKIAKCGWRGSLSESRGQLAFEWGHLLGKLERRAPELFAEYRGVKVPRAHPLFRIVAGGVRDWERV